MYDIKYDILKSMKPGRWYLAREVRERAKVSASVRTVNRVLLGLLDCGHVKVEEAQGIKCWCIA